MNSAYVQSSSAHATFNRRFSCSALYSGGRMVMTGVVNWCTRQV